MNRAVDGARAWAPAIDGWAREALAELTALPGVRRVGLAVSEGGGRRLLFAASDRDNAERIDWCEVDAYQDVPLNTAVRSGDSITGSLAELQQGYPAFVSRQDPTVTSALVAVPIRATGQVLGGIVLYLAGTGSPDTSDLESIAADLGRRLRRSQRLRRRHGRRLADEPVPEDARAVSYDVDTDPRTVGDTRRSVAATLSTWGLAEEQVETAGLCLSELITNALIHTTRGCEVRVVLDGGVLTATVRDEGSEHLPQPAETDVLAGYGRGLQIVDALASRWGSVVDAVGTTVWFVLDT
ncbi:ATP-binding protein [Nocardioides terrisoli]|uniref:ATP-binding protein n=1 Tax=Nocardioides terrisoli TaxID=3388267 RepID=UPI00287BB6D6|nr:ATP-binding protein [Nocardioides marmorisolisilvae]